ncbi:MAG: hypothetical protein C7B46_12885 [Sulfobacillus benefaciens]|uniref:Uncharacterized protein n=1 Tax=Sulfobacillus benefaciens TaxID=453960 RepID=A0A2T2XE76_9FIRM|nr:MAG: hypothetical protein C7B46_12885 [Sulfobacillus benefaciens]
MAMVVMTAYLAPIVGHEWAHPVLSPTPGWFYGIMAVVGAGLCVLWGRVWQAHRDRTYRHETQQKRYAGSHRHTPRSHQASPTLPWPHSRIHRIRARWRTPRRGREKRAPLVQFSHTIYPPRPPRAFPHRR